MLATHYEGEPPDDAVATWEKLCALADPTLLTGVRYLAFALGDLTYKHYCGFGKNVNKKLTELGATSIHELGTGSNDQNKVESFFLKWKEGIWGDVQANVPENRTFGKSVIVSKTSGEKPGSKYIVSVERGEETPLNAITNIENYDVTSTKYLKAFSATILDIKELRQVASEIESTLLLELKLPEGKSYKTAGNVLLFPENSPDAVKKALECVGLRDEELLVIKPGQTNPKMPCPERITVGNFFRSFVDLQGMLKKSTLKNLAKIVSCPRVALQLERLTSKDCEEEFEELTRKHYGLIDIITNFDIRLEITDLVNIANRILPRYFTISSSAVCNPNILTLTASISSVEVGVEHKYGLASAFFQRLQKAYAAGRRDLTIRIDTLDSCFHLPAKPHTDCIFVSTGAGFAPFAGMLQEKKVSANSSTNPFGNINIFFGCRLSTEDYIFKEDISRYLISGVVKSCFEAFSRQDVLYFHIAPPKVVCATPIRRT